MYFVSENPERAGQIFTSGWTRRLAIRALQKSRAISAVTRPVLRVPRKAPDAEPAHFIGKDIVYFHSLSGLAMPAATQADQPCSFTGYVTVNGAACLSLAAPLLRPKAPLETSLTPTACALLHREAFHVLMIPDLNPRRLCPARQQCRYRQ